MAKRRSLTPGTGSQKGDVHATRRGSGGARREITDRVCLRAGAAEHTGWALNASRGGIRLIVEDKVELGSEYEVELGSAGAAKKRKGRVVWVQEEADGMIVGVEFIDQKSDGSETPATGSEPPGMPSSARVRKGD
jgi:hypothetical protein